MSCYRTGDFGRYWEENMEALGMWIPASSYEAVGGLAGLITAVASAVEANPGATLYQALIRAKISVIGGSVLALSASA